MADDQNPPVTTTPDNRVTMPPSPVTNFVTQARAAGYGWDEINARTSKFEDGARKAGYSDQEIRKYLGAPDPATARDRMAATAQTNLNANPPQAPAEAGNWWEDFKAGVERSSGGIVIHGAPTLEVNPAHAGFLGRLAGQAGEVVGDLPFNFIGATGGAAAGAAVPGAGETGVSEAYGGYFGMGALPAAIKSEYAAWRLAGHTGTPRDFLTSQGGAILQTLKAGAISTITMGAGEAAAGGAAAAGAGVGTTAAIKTGAQITAMTAATSAMEGHLPTAEEIADNAILLAGFKGVEKLHENVVSPIKANLIRNWRDTGQRPADATRQATNDPAFRTQIVTPAHPDPPPASSHTSTSTGNFVLPRVTPTHLGVQGNFNAASDLVTLHTRDGVAYHVNKAYAEKFAGFVQELEDSGYKVSSVEGYNPRDVHGTDKGSYHAEGAAIDINPKENEVGSAGHLPKDIAEMAARHGLGWGGAWKSKSDPMHFSVAQSEGGSVKIARPVLSEHGGAGGTQPPAQDEKFGKGNDPWERIASTIAPPDKGPSFWERGKAEAYKAYTDLFNPLHPIQMLQRAATQGAPLDDASNPEFLYRIAENHSTHAMYNIGENATDIDGKITGPGLNKIIEPFGRGDELAKFWTYKKAEWAIEKGEADKATGVSLDDARQVVAEGKAKYGAASQQLQDWQNNTLKWLRDTGVLSEASHKAMLDNVKSRIPAYREGVGAKSVSGRGAGKTAYNPVKAFEGSTKRTVDPYQALMQDAFLRSQVALYNRANARLTELAEPLGLATMTGSKLITKSMLDESGIEDEDMDSTISRMVGQRPSKDSIPVLSDGHIEQWKFEDPNIARVLKGMDAQTQSLFVKMAAPFTKFFRASIALNPLFPVRLMTYDVPWQFITKPGMQNTVAQVYTGLRDIIGHYTGRTADADVYDQWMRGGGAEKVFNGLSKQGYIKKMLAGHGDPAFAEGIYNLAKTPYRALQAWSQILMQAQRVGRFHQGQEQGIPPKELAVTAADAAFHRAGFGGPLGKQINTVQPFTAAYLNSLEQTFRAFTGHALTGETVYDAKTVALNVAKALAVVTIPMIANAIMNRDKDWYKAIPDWQKDNAIFFRFGGDGPDGYTLPFKFPPVISFLFGGLPRRLMEQFYEDNPHAWNHVGEGAIGTLTPPGGMLAYNVMTPIVEHIANHSFFKGHELVSDETKNSRLPPEQASPYSSVAAKAASKYLNVAPQVIDNYINGWGGTLGSAAIRALGNTIAPDPKAPSTSVMDLPGLSSWQARYPSSNAQPIVDFEDRVRDMEMVHGSLIYAFQQHNLSRFQEIAQGNPAAAAMHKYGLRGTIPPEDQAGYMNQLEQAHSETNLGLLGQLAQKERAIKNLKTYIKQVYEQDPKNYTPEDKKQLLDQAYITMQKAAEDGNKLMDELKIK